MAPGTNERRGTFSRGCVATAEEKRGPEAPGRTEGPGSPNGLHGWPFRSSSCAHTRRFIPFSKRAAGGERLESDQWTGADSRRKYQVRHRVGAKRDRKIFRKQTYRERR